jgi:hypothetical protein
VLGDHAVFEDGEPANESDVLERPADPTCDPTVGGKKRDVLAAVLNRSGVGLVETGDAVEQGRLAGAVGTDEPDDLPLGDVDVHVLEGDEPAEADTRVLDL